MQMKDGKYVLEGLRVKEGYKRLVVSAEKVKWVKTREIVVFRLYFNNILSFVDVMNQISVQHRLSFVVADNWLEKVHLF